MLAITCELWEWSLERTGGKDYKGTQGLLVVLDSFILIVGMVSSTCTHAET